MRIRGLATAILEKLVMVWPCKYSHSWHHAGWLDLDPENKGIGGL